MILISISFMSFCTLLYVYLNYLAEGEDDEDLLEAARRTATSGE